METIRDVYFCNICNDIIGNQEINSKGHNEDQSKCSKCSNRNDFEILNHMLFFLRLRIFHFDIINKDTSKPYQKLEFFVSEHH